MGQVGTRPGDGPEADDIAEAGRVAQRAAEVAAVGDREHAAGQRHRRAAAAAAAGLASGRRGCSVAPKTALKVCEPAPNSGVLVLPIVIAPARLQPLDDERVLRRARSRGRSASRRWCGCPWSARGPCGRSGSPCSGPTASPRASAASARARPASASLRQQRDDRVDLRVDALDLRQVRLHHLGHGGAARADQLAERGRGQKADVVHGRDSMARRVYRKRLTSFTRFRVLDGPGRHVVSRGQRISKCTPSHGGGEPHEDREGRSRSSVTAAGGRGRSSRSRPTTASSAGASAATAAARYGGGLRCDDFEDAADRPGPAAGRAPVLGHAPRHAAEPGRRRRTRRSRASSWRSGTSRRKALGVPVYELFGGPMRDRMRLYWSHCGTTRARLRRDARARRRCAPTTTSRRSARRSWRAASPRSRRTS